jgi:hypothetical protein
MEVKKWIEPTSYPAKKPTSEAAKDAQKSTATQNTTQQIKYSLILTYQTEPSKGTLLKEDKSLAKSSFERKMKNITFFTKNVIIHPENSMPETINAFDFYFGNNWRCAK